MSGRPTLPHPGGTFDSRAATLTLLLLCAATLGVSAVRAVSHPLTAGPQGARYIGPAGGQHVGRIRAGR